MKTKSEKKTKPTRPFTVRYQIRSTQGELTTTHMVVVNATTPAAAKRAVNKLVVTQVAEPEARSLVDVAEQNRLNQAVEGLLDTNLTRRNTLDPNDAIADIKEDYFAESNEKLTTSQAYQVLNAADLLLTNEEIRPYGGEPLEIDIDTEEEPKEYEDDEDVEDESPKLTPGTIDLPGDE
jgi:hypothetical protein